MQITTLNQDIDTLLKGWPQNEATSAQQARWPTNLQPQQLGNDAPDCLRLLAEDGSDGEPVFKNNDHRWPADRDLIRLGCFFHLELERTLAMALKAQWEPFFEKESRIDNLTAFPDEAKQLSLEFNPGYGRCADADALYDLFEEHSHYASEAGYDRDKFKTLIHQTIMAHGHLFGIRSLELDAFVAERRKEQALVKDASQSEQDEFWRAKLMWLEQRRILEQWLLELENQRLKNANIQQKWMATFGELYFKVMEAQYQVLSLQRRIQFKQTDPGLSQEDLDQLEQQAIAEERAILAHLQQEIAFAKLLQIFGPNGLPVGPKERSEYEQECKRVLFKIHAKTHPDRLPEGFTEQQKQALLAHFNAARQINREEIGLDRRALDKLYDILAQVEALWESMGVDIDTRLVIRGETLQEQMAWLQTENTRLEGEVEELRNELTVLSEDQDIQEKLYSLASEDGIAQMKDNMKAKLTTSQAQISELEAELAALFR
ncbi:hypothetical protein THIOM_004564 [Candidatus Thiomargarita nelsonii]|uniref:J domain-containing protein n=1 Tax=Candidatus Thiomargarita nelsonii TaxID=1003181 RepID=A0A176RVN4_9GAMM|nr:hypothetical protein THIOM_004564 [Candidatus Thiomargarita nelsonii]